VWNSLKSAMSRFGEAFWAGFEQARAESRARAQPPLDAGNPFEGQTEAEIKATLAAAIRGAFDEGVSAEKARVGAILTAPNAAQFLELAADLALGPATSDQAIKVLTRAESDAATRAGLIKSNLLDRASADGPTLH
jgi:hypothetical protein